MILDEKVCLDWINAINEAYLALRRPGQDAQKIVDLKLRAIFWRSRLLELLLTKPPAWLTGENSAGLDVFVALNVHLSPQQLALAGQLLDQESMAKLMARQGKATTGYPGLDRESGPGVDLKIVANRGSSMPYEKWRENDLFSRYEYEEEGVRFRGVSFRPGDVLLANVNLDGNGVYTSLSEPRSFSSHAAFFAILEHDGKRFPVAVETYEKGVRPVPLNIFLGPDFCSYIEVYRHGDYRAEHAPEINRAAAGFIDSVRGYNFDAEDSDPTYMACGSVGRFMHRAAGLQAARTISKLSHPRVQSNLATVGYHFFDYFGPVDFLLNECFYCQGVVDNNQVERLLARELIDQEFMRQFSNRDVDSSKFPLMFSLNRWGIGQMRRETLVGKLVCLIEGFTADNLPRGPDDLLAMILIAEKQIGKSIIRTRATIEEVIAEYEDLEMESLKTDPRMVKALQNNLSVPWLQEKAPGVLQTVSSILPLSDLDK
jgi:hypothetical protein